MTRSFSSWMALVAALSVAIAALRGSTEGWAVAILAIEAIGLVAAIAWGITRRSWPALAFAALTIAGLVAVETPAIRGRTTFHVGLIWVHDQIGTDRRGETRLPRSSFDESYSRWIEAHPDRWVHAVDLDEEGATLRWGESTLGPFLKIAGRLLALLPAALVAAILAAWNRRRARPKEAPQCPA